MISVIAITGFLWLALNVVLHGKTFEMDSNSGRHSFHALFAIYRQIYSGLFIFGSLLSLIASHNAVCRMLLALSAVYALFTVLWLTFCYEQYQHARYQPNGQSTYKGWKYGLTLTLGAMSPVLFAIGLVMAAHGK